MSDGPLFLLSYLALWALVIFQTLVLLELVRQDRHPAATTTASPDDNALGDMLVSGSVAPEFEGRDIASGTVVHSSSLRGRPLALIFVSPTCSSCEAIAGELAAYQRRSGAQLVLLCRGGLGDCTGFVRSHFADTLALQDEDGAAAKRYKVISTPTAVLLDGQGRILRYGFPRPKLQLGLEDVDLPKTAATAE